MDIREKITEMVILCLLLPHCARSQEAIEHPNDLKSVLAEFHDTSWEARRLAFYRLISRRHGWDGYTVAIPSRMQQLFKSFPGQREDVTVGLIDLLAHENLVVKNPKREFAGNTLTETYTDYYGDLIATVASLKDPRYLEVMLGALTTGNMATTAIANLGPRALDSVLAATRDKSPVVRSSAVSCIRNMLEPERGKIFEGVTSHQKIKKALLATLQDQDPGVRLIAVQAIALLKDPVVLRILQTIAQSDPEKRKSFDGSGSHDFYPVREAAKNALSRIKRGK